MVSVLIPVYNTSNKWLLQCHLSIMNQAVKGMEIIYVNDCSTNKDTLTFLNDVKRNPICKVIDLAENCGISKALNIGLQQCKYDLVARMDSDDIMLRGRLDAQIKYLQDNPIVDVVGTQINLLKEANGEFIMFPDSDKLPLNISIEIIKKRDYVLAHPTVMFRKNKVLAVGGYDDSLNGFSEDFELWARMLKYGMILHNLPQVFLNYRISETALSKKLGKENKEFINKIRHDYFNGLFTNDEKLRIGFLVIATNKYSRFVKPLVDSINCFFLPTYDKTIFCFTDDLDVDVPKNVVKIYQEHQPWPMPTLKRYEIIYRNSVAYQDIDVLYYIDADMLICGIIGQEILPLKTDLVAVIHPGYHKDRIQSFEKRKASTAYVDDTHYIYHCGGIQGGRKDKYLNACEELMNNINKDLEKNIIAVWHDESHWNSYLIRNPKSYVELNSSYCYPESWNLNLPKKILALDKNHSDMRN